MTNEEKLEFIKANYNGIISVRKIIQRIYIVDEGVKYESCRKS